MKLDDLKNGLNNWWNSVAEGLNKFGESAAGALTRFNPTNKSDLPSASNIDDKNYSPTAGWAMLAGNVFESEKSVLVRLEIPGLNKENINIELVGDTLVVSGEKRFEKEHSEGRYRVFQCAYGSFQRSVRLPVKVLDQRSKATYKDGILEIELQKAEPTPPRIIEVKIT